MNSDFKTTGCALVLGLLLLLSAPARAATAGCDTDQRVASFAALLKTKPDKNAVEEFIRKNKIAVDQPFPRPDPALLIASVSDSDCDPLDYQHTQHVFYIRLHKGAVLDFSETLASGGP